MPYATVEIRKILVNRTPRVMVDAADIASRLRRILARERHDVTLDTNGVDLVCLGCGAVFGSLKDDGSFDVKPSVAPGCPARVSSVVFVFGTNPKTGQIDVESIVAEEDSLNDAFAFAAGETKLDGPHLLASADSLEPLSFKINALLKGSLDARRR